MRKDGSKLTLDLTTMDGDPSADDNKVLKDGDELYVPRNPVQISLVGGVKKEGQYRVPANTTLLEAIAVAGGLDPNAILDECMVMRTSPAPAQIPVNLEKLLKKGDPAQNPVLQDRDVIMIKTRNVDPNKKPVLDTVTDAMTKYWWLFHVL